MANTPQPDLDNHDSDGPVPEDQQPGHHPDHEQDKPDLDAMAARLGVVSEDEAPADAPHVEPDDTKEEIEKQRAIREERLADQAGSGGRSKLKIGLALLAPAIAYVTARAAVRAMRRPRLPFS